MGAAIITGNTNPLDSGLLITLNSGSAWTFDDAPGTPDSGTAVYFNPSNHLLFVSSLDKGLVVSSDTGKTWKVIDPAKYYTGFAFTDGNRGVVATQGSDPNGFLPVNFWRFTTDGGLTWPVSRMFYESWQPVGIPTTETFFASTDYSFGPSLKIYRSDNNGYSYLPTPFSTTGDTLTEAMQGDGCSLFASSVNSHTGMYYSVNEGTTWLTMPPTAPNPGIYTRFYVSDTMVWSFTNDILSFIRRIGTPSVHIWPDSIAFTNAGCQQTVDTTIHIFGCNCGNNPTIQSITVNNAISTDMLTATTPGTLPHPLCTSTTSEQGNPDSILIGFQPTAANPNADSGTIDVKYTDNGVIVDTFIKIHTNAISPSAQLDVPTHRVVLSGPACGPEVDTCFTISNTSCSCIQILRIHVNEPPEDTCSLKIPFSPFTLNPGESTSICVQFFPGLQSGTVEATFSYDWHACFPGTASGTTSPLIDIAGVTTTTEAPSFRGFSISVPEKDGCCFVPADTLIYFLNTTCETLTLNTPNFFNHVGNASFSVDNTNPLYRHTYPLVVPPGTTTLPSIVPLLIKIAGCGQGTSSEKLAFSYAIGSSTDCSSIPSGGDTATLSIVSGGPITEPTVKPASLNFSVSACDSTAILTGIITNGCKADTIKSILFDSGKGHFRFAHGDSLVILQPGQKDTIQIGFIPAEDTAFNGSITLNFMSAFNTGDQLIFNFSGKGTNQAAASLSNENIDFGTLDCNQSACDTVWIKNASCSPIKVSSIIQPHAPFTLDATGIPATLGVGDSAKVSICVSPNTNAGATDSAIFILADLGGAIGIADTLHFTATFTPPAPSFTLTQPDTATICLDSTLDETFSFTNTGTCYTYDITGATATSGAQVTATPIGTGYPVHVPVGGTQTFTVHFAPTGAGILSGTITLADSGGHNIAVPYSITVDTCNKTVPVLTLSDTNTNFITSNCTPLSRIFAIAAASGTVTVTSVTLTSGTQFTESLSQTLPFTVSTTDTLYDTVTYSPDASGPNSATLTVGNLPALNLTGAAVGAHFNAKFGISTASPLLDSPNVALTFTISLDSLIPDDIGMTNLTIVVDEPGGLLTLLSGSPSGVAPWQADASQPPGESSPWTIHLKYTGPTTPGQMIAGGPIATFKAYTAIGKVNTTSVSIGAPDVFNDTNFARCKMSAESDGSSIPLQILLSCSDSIIVKALNGNLQTVVPNVEIIPNPAHKNGSAATLHFTSNVSAPFAVDIVNELGNSVEQLLNGPVEKGDHTIAIPTDNLAEGAYFVRITVNGYTTVHKFVLEKE